MFLVVFGFQLQDQILFQLDVVMFERIRVLAPDLQRIINDELKNRRDLFLPDNSLK
jgi:hypothetical protein